MKLRMVVEVVVFIRQSIVLEFLPLVVKCGCAIPPMELAPSQTEVLVPPLIVSGMLGDNGHLVPRRVVVEPRPRCEPRTLLNKMVELAVAPPLTQRLATLNAVPLIVSTIHGLLGLTALCAQQTIRTEPELLRVIQLVVVLLATLPCSSTNVNALLARPKTVLGKI
jgi:hypothetical protein